MCSQVSVNLFTAGGGAVVPSHHTYLGLYPPWNHTPRTITPRTVPQGLYHLRTVPPSPLDHTNPTRNHKSGRYACYWNAALSIESTGSPSREERSRPFCTQTTARHHQTRMLMSSAGNRCHAPVELLGNFTYV